MELDLYLIGLVDIADEYLGKGGCLEHGFTLRRESGPLGSGPFELVSEGNSWRGIEPVVAIVNPSDLGEWVPIGFPNSKEWMTTFPVLPSAIWMRECYRLGLNPLPICRRQFSAWSWKFVPNPTGTTFSCGYEFSDDSKIFMLGVGKGKVFATR